METEELTLSRRVRRWLSKHRAKIIQLAFVVLLGGVAFLYFALLGQLLIPVLVTNPFMSWTILAVNVLSALWLFYLLIWELKRRY